MGGLGITIQGRALVHKLFHAVLPYSNWEWAVRAHSEWRKKVRPLENDLEKRSVP
jgi:hypothetical protein